jgi:hypothetical protein
MESRTCGGEPQLFYTYSSPYNQHVLTNICSSMYCIFRIQDSRLIYTTPFLISGMYNVHSTVFASIHKLINYRRRASKRFFMAAIHKTANSLAHSAIANPQISTKYCTPLSQNRPKSCILTSFFTNFNWSIIYLQGEKYVFADLRKF